MSFFLVFISEILCDSKKLLYLCNRKINECPASDEFSLVGDGHFFV